MRTPGQAPITELPPTPKRLARPRITNSRDSTLSLNSGGARRAPAPEQVDSPHHERHRDRVVQVVEVVPDPLPVLAQNVPQIGQREDPGYAPEERVEGELRQVHPGGSGGKGDKSADHGQAAGDTDGELPVLVEPLLRDEEVMLAHPDVTPVVEPQLAPAPQPDKVSDPRPDQVPQDPCGHRRQEGHP